MNKRKVVYEVQYSPSYKRAVARAIERDVISRGSPYAEKAAIVVDVYEASIRPEAWSRMVSNLKRKFGSTGQLVEKAAFDWVKANSDDAEVEEGEGEFSGTGGLDGVGKGTRKGTRVRFNALPGSLVLYTHHPEIGEEGTVGTMPGFGKRTYLPGPGGGLLYVDWDQSGMIGVSPNDVKRIGWRGMEGLSEYEGEMKSLSYGVMPSKAEFVTRTEGQYPYPMELVGADQELVQDLLNDEGIEEFDSKYRNKLGVRVIDAKAMYRFLTKLKEKHDSEEEGNDAAGDLASSILSTLGYEWI